MFYQSLNDTSWYNLQNVATRSNFINKKTQQTLNMFDISVVPAPKDWSRRNVRIVINIEEMWKSNLRRALMQSRSIAIDASINLVLQQYTWFTLNSQVFSTLYDYDDWICRKNRWRRLANIEINVSP